MNRSTKTIWLGAVALGMGMTAGWVDADPLPAPAQNAPALGGVTVRVDGEAVGRLVGYLEGLVLLDLSETAAEPGTVLAAQAGSLWVAPMLELVSPTGYFFHISAGSLDSPAYSEGELQRAPVIFYDSPNCGGQAYLPIRNESGRFGVWELGNGRLRPVNRWAARQGMIVGSSDPADPTQAYMVRRGTDIEEVFLQSFKVFAPAMTPPGAVCVSPPLLPAYDLAVRLVPLDPAEAGVAGTLGGEITVGL